MNILPYKPHPLLRSGHLQTIMVGLTWGETPPYNATQRTFATHDGEALVVHEENGGPLAADAPLTILIHGLGGDHRSAYLQRLAPRIRMSGSLVWRIDLRGCGAGDSLACKPANAGMSCDIATVIANANRLYPNRKIQIVGFSLSGNIVLKFLGEMALGQTVVDVDPSSISKAITIAPPANLHACSDNMDRFSRRLYAKFYLKSLAAQVDAKRKHWPRWKRISENPKLKTIRQFDARYTAPLGGFANTDDYYTRSSSLPLLKHINVPTLVIVDRHDPIVPYSAFQYCQFSDTTEVLTTKRGGHMGYFGLDPEGKNIRWVEHVVYEHCKS